MGTDTDPTNIMAMSIVFLILCPTIVAFRFATRIQQKSRIGVDDWLMLPALLMVVGCAIDMLIGVSLRVFGYPTPPPPPVDNPDDATSYNYTTVEQLEWAFFLMQIISMGCIKLSFVFFSRRIFVTGNVRSKFNYITLGAVILIILWTITFFFWFLFSCGTTFYVRWETVDAMHQNCPTDLTGDIALATSDFITDFMILFLPVPMVLRLQMKMKRKLAIIAVFALGAVAMVASIIRMAIFFWAVGVASGRIVDPNVDNDLLVTSGLYWSMLESGLALIACCLPAMQAFFRVPIVRSVLDSMYRFSSLGSRGSRGISEHRQSRKGSVTKPWASGDKGRLSDSESGRSRSEVAPNDSSYELNGPTQVAPSENVGHEEHRTGILVERTVDLTLHVPKVRPGE